jgi:hypothetical protein
VTCRAYRFAFHQYSFHDIFDAGSFIKGPMVGRVCIHQRTLQYKNTTCSKNNTRKTIYSTSRSHRNGSMLLLMLLLSSSQWTVALVDMNCVRDILG